MENKRIYCVVAHTVQPLIIEDDKPKHDVPSFVQPAGRQIAQACHAVSLMRLRMVGLKGLPVRVIDALPITTIILQARDTFELVHIQKLLNDKGYVNYAFHDSDQPDYGDVLARIFTALATEPMTENQAVGILDYLPLWTPEG